MKYSVERLRSDDIDDLFEYRFRVMPDNIKRMDRKRWDWLYQQNPFTDNLLPVWIIRSKGKIVGAISAILLMIRLENRFITAYHGADFFVQEGFKGLPALRLYKTMISHCDLFIGANLSASAKDLFLHMGSVDLSSSLYTAHMNLRLEKTTLPRYMFQKFMLFLTMILDKIITIKSNLSNNIPDRYEELWDLILKFRTSGIEKNRTYLEWRYVQCPSKKYQFLALSFKKRLRCLSILSVNKAHGRTTGLILDIIMVDKDYIALAAVIKFCIEYFTTNGCESCHLHWNALWARPFLRALGFYIATSDIGFLLYFDKRKHHFPELMQNNNWNFSLGDTDRF